MVLAFVGAHPVGDGRGTSPASHRPQGGLLKKTIHLHVESIAANKPQVQYVTRPLRFICREAQVALSDSTPHTAITPR